MITWISPLSYDYLSNVSYFLMITLVTTLYRDYLGITTLPLLIWHHHSTMINCVSPLPYANLDTTTLLWLLGYYYCPMIMWISPLSYDYLGITTVLWSRCGFISFLGFFYVLRRDSLISDIKQYHRDVLKITADYHYNPVNKQKASHRPMEI